MGNDEEEEKHTSRMQHLPLVVAKNNTNQEEKHDTIQPFKRIQKCGTRWRGRKEKGG